MSMNGIAYMNYWVVEGNVVRFTKPLKLDAKPLEVGIGSK